MPINVTLPNGRRVDTETPSGANYFINYPNGPFEFFSQNIPSVKVVCDRVHSRRPPIATPQEIDQMTLLYGMADALAKNASPDVFAKIPTTELTCYMEHVMGELRQMIQNNNTNWARSGKLTQLHENVMLGGLIELFMHAAPCKFAFETDFFGTLAEFASVPRHTVSEDPAETITMLVANAIISTLIHKEDLPTTSKAFERLESCGMLEQFIRLSVVSPTSSPGILKFYDLLIECRSLIRKKFTDDQPCGKVCKEILKKKNAQHPVVTKLQSIMSFTSFIQKEVESELKNGYKSCRKCNKMEHDVEFQKGLMKCSRCKSAFYCSRECQVADWKRHKKICLPVSKNEAKMHRFNEQTVHNFVLTNYVEILRKIVDFTSEKGVSKADMLLELDFVGTGPDGMGGGVAPAFKTPPEFKIADTKGYYEGSRPNEPDWFYKNEDKACYEGNIPSFIRALKDTYKRMTDHHLLVLVRSPAREFGVYRVQFQSPTTRNQMFSQETVAAATVAIQDKDFGPLTSLFGEDCKVTKALKREFGAFPDEADLEMMRVMLTHLGANF